MPPVVRVLEASTGRALHTIDGLSWPGVADLDGDGLEDLWGSVDGKLRAFRAGLPETWRRLDDLVPVGDLDGDGIADAMTVELRTSDTFEKVKTDSRTAVARSGRDGRDSGQDARRRGEPAQLGGLVGPQLVVALDPLDLPAPQGRPRRRWTPERGRQERGLSAGRQWGPRTCPSRSSRVVPAVGSGRPVRCHR